MKQVLVAEEAVQAQATAKLIAKAHRDITAAMAGERALAARRILVVDENIRNILATTSTLEKNGAEVETARDSSAALKKLKDCHQIDLVLLDIMTPGADTALQEIRRKPCFSTLQIIVLTRSPTHDDSQWLDAGANACIAKPIDSRQLISLMCLCV